MVSGASAFQPNAFQNNAFQVQPFFSTNARDFIDYIFKFPDQGSYQRDTVVQSAAPAVNGTQPGVQLLVYNPVETLFPPVPASGNTLVLTPQLANSTVPLSGFWAMITLQTTTGALPTPLTSHPNIQIVNDRTLMFAQQPSVILNNIDVSHINIIINIFGTYVTDGLTVITVPNNALSNDAGTVFLLDDPGINFLIVG